MIRNCFDTAKWLVFWVVQFFLSSAPSQWFQSLFRCRIATLNFSMGFGIIAPWYHPRGNLLCCKKYIYGTSIRRSTITSLYMHYSKLHRHLGDGKLPRPAPSWWTNSNFKSGWFFGFPLLPPPIKTAPFTLKNHFGKRCHLHRVKPFFP